ncbi:MAG: CDP-glucose 4,6-dehydratase [Chitinophagaceae bacterium]|nr:CDP-glucose 4,6-dehydratase [Chitinophagaceae bacterium]
MVSIHYLKPYFENKKVFLTGHTGFKGAWMLQILSLLGAKVTGYSLAADEKSLYNQIDGDSYCEKSYVENINNIEKLKAAINETNPDFIFHFAAQALVLEGYKNPITTFETNVMGTANVLESLRALNKKCVAIIITTDKVYENNNVGNAFLETDRLGGNDPYSASKAACEIVIESYKKSFFATEKFDVHQKSISILRAGNVIGGGDYSPNRIIPDIINAIEKNEELILRQPNSTRPWQHVLEPLSAYLFLATNMVDAPQKYNEAFNIGPEKEDELRVEELTKLVIAKAKKGTYKIDESSAVFYEAKTLMLDNSKIKNTIGWKPKINAKEAIEKTADWYLNNEDAAVKCLVQINDFFENKINDFDEN